jgi:DNA polymerase-1
MSQDDWRLKVQLITIKTPKAIDDLIRYLQDKDFIAYDCETTGLAKDSEVVGVSVCAEESHAYYIVLAEWDKTSKSLLRLGLTDKVKELVVLLSKKQTIMHNAVYDCMIAENFFKVNLIDSLHTDTMILAHILNENRSCGLKSLAVEMYGESADAEAKEMKVSVAENGGLITKDHFELYKANSSVLAKYGAKDAWLTYRLFLDLVPELYEQKLDKFFYEDESMPLLKGPTYQLNTTGLKVDVEGLTTLKKTLEAECEELKTFINNEIQHKIRSKYPGTSAKTTFNINSNQQLSWLLFGEMELEFGSLTKAGKEACKEMGLPLPHHQKARNIFLDEAKRREGTIRRPGYIHNGKKISAQKYKSPFAYIECNNKILGHHAPQYKWIASLLKLKKNEKILSTYIEGIESRIRYGVIQPGFLQHGTTAGRYSSVNPNFQNLPRDDKRIKNCFVARPGKVFVGSDFSQLEPRVFAAVSGDKNLLAAFKSDQDFYSAIGIPVFDCYDAKPYKDGSPDAFGVKYPKERKMTKEIALASTYGATARRLSSMIGKCVADTQDIIDAYFEKFSGVKSMIDESHAQVKKQGYVTSIFGRPRRLPEAKKFDKLYGKCEDLPYEARNILNLSVNHRIQSTAASICNRAMIKFYNDTKQAGIVCSIVSQIHDEIIVECEESDASSVELLLQNAMETAVELPGVSLEAIPHTAKSIGGLK